jgi:hypothetical protein
MHATDRLSGVLSSLAHSNNSTETPTDTVLGSMTDYKFFGWVGKDKNCIGNLVWEEYEPKKWTEDDVDIKISMSLLTD